MTRFSKESLENNHTDTIRELVVKIGNEARRAGLKVSTSELVEFSKLLDIYYSLSESFTVDDLYLVACSVICKRKEDKEILAKIIKEIINSKDSRNTPFKDIIRGIYRDLNRLGLHPGSKIKKPRDFNSSEELRAAYARLRLLGVLQYRGGSYVLNEAGIRSIAKRLSKKSNGYRDAVSRIILANRHREAVLSLAAQLGSELFEYIDLKNIGINDLAKIYHYSRDKVLRRQIASIAHTIAREREVLTEEEAYNLLNVLRKENMLTEDILEKIVISNPRTVDNIRKIVSKDTLLDIAIKSIKRLGNASKGAEITAKALGLSSGYRGAIQEILRNNSLLEALQKGEIDGQAIEILNRIAEARNLLSKSLKEGLNTAYSDYALSELEKAASILKNMHSDNDKVMKEIKRIYESVMAQAKLLTTGDIYAVLKSKVREMGPADAIRFLYEVAAHSKDKKLRLLALRLLSISIKRAIGNKYTINRWATKTRKGQGRIDVHKTIMLLLRWRQDVPVARQKARRKGIVLVVDKSASMNAYAVNALLAATALAPFVRKIVFFDSDVYVVNRIDQVPIHQLISMVLGTKFYGYTNIIKALEEAVKGLSPTKLVLISDLKQTVRPYTEADVCKKLSELRRRGWIIVLIVPMIKELLCTHNEGIRVYTISHPNDIRKVLLKL
ncbi:hypothetical protein PYJP_08910 [Pyrofollis japonicus]|nr:hypothetical protein PYJP_08910 [Pyrofollis japonicus]